MNGKQKNPNVPFFTIADLSLSTPQQQTPPAPEKPWGGDVGHGRGARPPGVAEGRTTINQGNECGW